MLNCYNSHVSDCYICLYRSLAPSQGLRLCSTALLEGYNQLPSPTQNGLAVLEHGTSRTGVTHLRLCHNNLAPAEYDGWLHGCIIQSCASCGLQLFWLMRRSYCWPFGGTSQDLECLACLWPVQPQTSSAIDSLANHYRPLQPWDMVICQTLEIPQVTARSLSCLSICLH